MLIIYRNAKVFVESKAANFSEEWWAKIGLSRKPGETNEIVECIGENVTSDELQLTARTMLGDETNIFRCIDPFLIHSFEPVPAALFVKYFCYKFCIDLHPKTYILRSLLRLTSIHLNLKLPGYNLVPTDKRKIFEKELRAFANRFQIKEY